MACSITFLDKHVLFILQYFCIFIFGVYLPSYASATTDDDTLLLIYLLVVGHSFLLAEIYDTTLSHQCDPLRPGKAGGIVLIVFGMIVAATTCILLMLLFTTATLGTIIIWIWFPWFYTIFKVIARRDPDITFQMLCIDAVLQKRFNFSFVAGLVYGQRRARILMDRKYIPEEEPNSCFSSWPESIALFIFLCLGLIPFVWLETSSFHGNFVEIFAMRSLFISVHISLLLPVLAIALVRPPGFGCLVEFMHMALYCVVCVYLVSFISTFTAVISCMLWIISIFIVVLSSRTL